MSDQNQSLRHWLDHGTTPDTRRPADGSRNVNADLDDLRREQEARPLRAPSIGTDTDNDR